MLTIVAILLLTQVDADKARIEYLRAEYQADAEKYVLADADQEPLELVKKPIMRWANDDDWSGDVYVWTKDAVPHVVGSILSGPRGSPSRMMFHEFHLVGEKPIAPADLLTRRRWQPAAGMSRTLVPGADKPGETPAARLTQMRKIMRDFSAHMEADGEWELRLLPQPLYRYGETKEGAAVLDGALFTYVWTKGTDPEVILLLEARREKDGAAWYYAPIRFSNRSLWVKHDGTEAWRVDSHSEPKTETVEGPYTTAWARDFPKEPPAPK